MKTRNEELEREIELDYIALDNMLNVISHSYKEYDGVMETVKKIVRDEIDRDRLERKY